jgi:SAM-dependent methyltransferase
VYSHALGGAHHFEVDRRFVERISKVTPQALDMARYNRAWVQRVVRYLVKDVGIRQFLDIGTGIPAEGNVHEIAQEIAPSTRVVYVDYDNAAYDKGRELLYGNRYATFVYEDLRLPETVLRHEETVKTLDFARPIAMIWGSIMHFVEDRDQPLAILSQYVNALKPGDYLALSHVTHEFVNTDDTERQASDGVATYNDYVRESLTPRSLDTIMKFFAGTQVVDPGVVPLPDWRPDSPDYEPDLTDTARAMIVGGVGRLV